MTLSNRVAIIGGGPAGLMAAQTLAQAGIAVDLYDSMPSVGRKFLLAGKGGLNLTHSEPFATFVQRYGDRQPQISPLLAQFTPQMLRNWASELGIATFVGSSGRIFPVEMKAAPLLRAWLRQLRQLGVRFHTRHRWCGWNAQQQVRFITPAGEKTVTADVLILALGGGSWAKLGSDGTWIPFLTEKKVAVAPLQPANCGFEVAWSDYFRHRFAATPLKSLVLSFSATDGKQYQQRGELMLTATGVEGSLIYAFSAALRETINATGKADIYLDLCPDRSLAQLGKALTQAAGSQSLANQLRRVANLTGAKAALLREVLSIDAFKQPEKLAQTIKALPLCLIKPRPLDEAISSAGGVSFSAMNQHLMLNALPGVFCAGEMLDWEAPTGGYLLTACFASGKAVGLNALAWLSQGK